MILGTWKSLCLLAMLMLVGCATKNVNQGVDPGQMVDTGLVFASVSTSVESGFGPVALFYFTEGGYVESREEHIPGATLKPSELEEDSGRLVVLEMPVGPNSLRYWQLTHGMARYTPAQPVPEIKFTVESGKALYLGNLHMNVDMGSNFLNQPVVGDLLPEIRDRSERDLAMFKSRYSRVSDADIIAKQPFLGVWLPQNPFLAP
ncbi:hypothetical protein [Halopseudomonas salina]|uniref:Lipoprotein n=1 Tax=Halopseudomonas salina TaxID=1323744 RepID=A0ABQ1P8H2_9GAMM|nr:hypothetical protein [Halopseudomonas salina]GGC90926.1 hypothetical protein GCM10007418_08250 [Halopseudomonas salina]